MQERGNKREDINRRMKGNWRISKERCTGEEWGKNKEIYDQKMKKNRKKGRNSLIKKEQQRKNDQ